MSAPLTLDGIRIILVDEFDKMIFENRAKDIRICKICAKTFEAFIIKDTYCSDKCYQKDVKKIKHLPGRPNLHFNPFVKTYFTNIVNQK